MSGKPDKDDGSLGAAILAGYALIRLCEKMGWIRPEEILEVLRANGHGEKRPCRP